MVLQVCRGSTGTPKGRRDGIPPMFDGGSGAGSAAEEKSVARGLIIDPGGAFIKVHTAELEQDRGGKIIKVHKAELEKDPNEVKGDILIRADLTAEQKSVARGFLLDPGGDNISPEITGDWKRNHHEEGQGAPAREGPLKDPGGQHAPAREGKIKDPGGGANNKYMYAGEGQILYPEITGTWRRNNPGEGQSASAGGEHNAQVRGGKIKDPGKGGNI